MGQIYERYWGYTAEYTNLNSEKALGTLRVIVEFIDQGKDKSYKKLQELLTGKLGIASTSVRKAINQYVKLGFIYPYLSGYPEETKRYLQATSDRQRTNIMSSIVYKYSSFDSSVTNQGNHLEINYLIKTLEQVKSLNYEQLGALMTLDLSVQGATLLNRSELDVLVAQNQESGFFKRKYNQINHLRRLLSQLDGVTVRGKVVYLNSTIDDTSHLDEVKLLTRDPYLQRIYKGGLIEESKKAFSSEVPKCMVEGLPYPSLIASHIKPYRLSNDVEAFDVNNGLLLSRNLDALFDFGYISFDVDGQLIPSEELASELGNYLSGYTLSKVFLTPDRVAYLEYHRDCILRKA